MRCAVAVKLGLLRVSGADRRHTDDPSRRVVLAVWDISHTVLLYFITLRTADSSASGGHPDGYGWLYIGVCAAVCGETKIGPPPSQPYDEGQTRNGVLEKALPGSIASI